MELVNGGAAIEGLKVAGHSRNPLKSYGLVRQNGHECEKFCATFDVKAAVESVAADALFVPTASLEPSDKIICDDVVIYSDDDRPKCKVSMASATHQANFWNFKQRTALVITKAHRDIQNAIEKREREAKRLAGR